MALLVTHSLADLLNNCTDPPTHQNAKYQTTSDNKTFDGSYVKRCVLGFEWCFFSTGSTDKLLVVAVSTLSAGHALHDDRSKSAEQSYGSICSPDERSLSKDQRQHPVTEVLIADEDGRVLQSLQPPGNEPLTCFKWSKGESCTQPPRPCQIPRPFGVAFRELK